MRHLLDKETLIIYLEGELNSSNSESIADEIDNVIAKNNFKHLVLDLDNLKYIGFNFILVYICTCIFC